MGPGKGFGERGVLNDLPRALSARIKGDGELIRIRQADFINILAP